MNNKFKSLCRYIELFNNWPVPALSRYLGHWLPAKAIAKFRDGRNLAFRPASDSVALGEIFITDSYKLCLSGPKNVQRVWDIGGNVGCFVVWAMKHFPGARFDSFEPCGATFDILQMTRNGNPKIDWTVHNFGLSDKEETCDAYVPDGHFGEASRYARNGKKVTFNLRALEAVWKEQGSPSIDLLKIDCEGGEYAILEGASPEFLSNVACLVMEVHEIPGKKAAQLQKILTDSGFCCKWFEGPQGIAFASKNSSSAH